MTIKSTPNAGTTFIFYLPRSKAELQNHNRKQGSDTVPDIANETILVVEDNGEVLDSAATMLRDLGYKVLVAADGVEALALLNGAEKIDLLFSDIVMPCDINSTRQNVRDSQRYEAVVHSNHGYRASRIKKECGPITDPELHASCIARFR